MDPGFRRDDSNGGAARPPKLQRGLLHRHALGEVAGLVDVAALEHGGAAGERLQPGGDPLLRQRLDDYRLWIRPTTIHLTGDRLKALGVRPGPIYRRLLQSVRAARLDGRCATPAEEEALALALIAGEKEDNG